MSYSPVITTKEGEKYLQDLIIAGSPLTFTKIITSVENHKEENAKELKKLGSIKQEISINRQEKFSGDSIQIEGTLTNEGLEGAHHIQTIGIYVQGDEILQEPNYKTDEEGELILDEEGDPIEIPPEPDYEIDEEGEYILDEEGNKIEYIPETKYEDVLYGVAIAREPFYMASPKHNQVSLTLNLRVFVGEAENIEIKVDPSRAATKSELQELLQELKNLGEDVEVSEAQIVTEFTKIVSEMNEAQTTGQAKANAEIMNVISAIMMMIG